MTMNKRFFFSLLWFPLSFLLFPTSVHAATICRVIAEDTTWSGEVAVAEDVLIRPGVTLTVLPGTVVKIAAGESTRTDPEYLSSLTEITVRGTLKALGTAREPIRFVMPDGGPVKGWAGIIVDGGETDLRHVNIEGAESGVTVVGGRAEIDNATLRRNRYGLSVVAKEATVRLQDSTLSENDYGLALLNGAEAERHGCRIRDNEKQDVFIGAEAPRPLSPPKIETTVAAKKSVYTNESLLGTVVWKDHVVIKGVVRVPAKSKLIIMPGAVIEFTKRDTNGDGFGENGLLVMGMLVAKGLPDKPIVFRSAAEKPAMGDWDAINIYSSDGVQNLIEYVRIEDAYRALHFHFSNVAVRHSVLRHNYRALQFQESLIDASYNDIYDNKSAIRARDSEVALVGNRVFDNYTGPNIFRVTGTVRDNVIADNLLDGLRVREGALEVRENQVVGNRYGLTVAYANHGNFSANVVSANIETGLTLKGTDSVKVTGNAIENNGTNGISVLDTQAVIKGNQITGNGERGIGVISFNGVITGNHFAGNRLYAIGLDGEGDVSAPGNWWGGGDLDKIIYDQSDDPALGRVDHSDELSEPIPFPWPTRHIVIDTTWQGSVIVPRKVTLGLGATLAVAPGTLVRFARKSSLWLNGNFTAVGTPERRITFTSLEPTDEQIYWDQITTEYAEATVENCDFSHANMGLHSHFSVVHVKNCTFTNNESGFRFRGGPNDIINNLFKDNMFGMVAYFAKAVIRDNIITANDIGFLVRRERNRGLAIHHNNIYDNSRYNLRMGDFNQGEDTDARENWWGEGDPLARIFDERREPDLGLAMIEPYADTPFSITIPGVTP